MARHLVGAHHARGRTCSMVVHSQVHGLATVPAFVSYRLTLPLPNLPTLMADGPPYSMRRHGGHRQNIMFYTYL